MGSRRDYDEEDVRVRPTRATRPRTRIRPRHEEAVEAMVTAVHLGRYACLTEHGPVTAMRARELGRRAAAVGDRVWLVGDVSGEPDALARIVRIGERRSVLRRSVDDEPAQGRRGASRGGSGRAGNPASRAGWGVLVANADQLVIVSALVDPPPRTGFIDRCLVAAYDAGIDPLLCLTKADLVTQDPAPLATIRDYYAELALPYLLSRPDQPLEALRAALRGRMSVLVGHSGVGKSTLVNRLVPEADRAVGAVSAVGKGRHVSSSAVALRLDDEPGTWIIDTPGVRSFGLAHVSADSLLAGFTDLLEGSARCPPGCDHQADDPAGRCALDAWVAAGNADPRRLASYRRLAAAKLAG